MAHGVLESSSYNLRVCDCFHDPNIYWKTVSGCANKHHFFVGCGNCTRRTKNDRKNIEGAIKEWEERILR